jgi:hypothetical protein
MGRVPPGGGTSPSGRNAAASGVGVDRRAPVSPLPDDRHRRRGGLHVTRPQAATAPADSPTGRTTGTNSGTSDRDGRAMATARDVDTTPLGPDAEPPALTLGAAPVLLRILRRAHERQGTETRKPERRRDVA